MIRKSLFAAAGLLLVFACAWCSSSRADINVYHDGVFAFCATGFADGFDGKPNYTGTCGQTNPPGTPALPAGMTRVGTAQLGYDVQWQLRTINVDFFDASQFLGRAAATDVGAGWPHTQWPHKPVVSSTDWPAGSGPVFTLRPNTIVCARLPTTPASGSWSNSVTPQNNVSGSNPAFRLDVTIGDDCTGVNARVTATDAYFNQRPINYTINVAGDPKTLLPNHAYFLGIRLSPARPPLLGPTGSWPVYIIHRTSKL